MGLPGFEWGAGLQLKVEETGEGRCNSRPSASNALTSQLFSVYK